MKQHLRGFALRNALLFIVASCLVIAWIFQTELNRLYHTLSWFDEDKIVMNMRTSDVHFPVSSMSKSSKPQALPHAEAKNLPETFEFGKQSFNTQDYLDYTHTGSLLVADHGKVRFEEYYRGETEADRHISFSVAKSFISAAFGVAVSEGKIDIQKNADDYVPMLKGSGYEGVRIKDILQMSSGVKFNEDYGDITSDINRFGQTMALGKSFDDFAASLVREVEPGTRRHYVSIDTQVLGMILTRATGQSISSYMQEKLWHPMGAESDAYWITDDNDMEMALGGLNAVLRDYARFGLLYLNEGVLNGKQIIPKQWFADSTTPDAPHLMPKADSGANTGGLTDWGYGYQWWIPPTLEGHNDVIMAIGIYDQYIYIDRKRQLVITKLSGNPFYTSDNYESVPKTLALFRAIALSYD